MPQPAALTILCIATFEKGHEFLRECHRRGHRVLLLTADKLREAEWPREAIDEFGTVADQRPLGLPAFAGAHAGGLELAGGLPSDWHLDAAGVHRDEGVHVAFSAPDVAEEASPVQSYGSSIPLSKACRRKCCWPGR